MLRGCDVEEICDVEGMCDWVCTPQTCKHVQRQRKHVKVEYLIVMKWGVMNMALFSHIHPE